MDDFLIDTCPQSFSETLRPITTPEYYPGFEYQAETMRRFIRNDPRVNKSKPMYYSAAGADLATFEGTGLQEADFVDPVYKYTFNEELKSAPFHGLFSLFERAKLIDPKATIDVIYLPEEQTIYAEIIEYKDGTREIGEYDEKLLLGPSQDKPDKKIKKRQLNVPLKVKAVEKGKITYISEGKAKTIRFEARDATNYVPQEVVQGGCSVYASIGHGVGELFEPPTQADAYVVSLLFPKAFGFGDLAPVSPDDLAICFSYRKPNLSATEKQILLTSNSINKLDRAIWAIKTGGKTLKEELAYLKKGLDYYKISVKNIAADIIEAFLVKNYYSDVLNLRPAIRNPVIDFVIAHINYHFGPESINKNTDLLKNRMIQALEKHREE